MKKGKNRNNKAKGTGLIKSDAAYKLRKYAPMVGRKKQVQTMNALQKLNHPGMPPLRMPDYMFKQKNGTTVQVESQGRKGASVNG